MVWLPHESDGTQARMFGSLLSKPAAVSNASAAQAQPAGRVTQPVLLVAGMEEASCAGHSGGASLPYLRAAGIDGSGPHRDDPHPSGVAACSIEPARRVQAMPQPEDEDRYESGTS